MKILHDKIIKLIIPVTFILFLLSGRIAFATWNGDFYNPGETFDPECLPTQTNCDVLVPFSLQSNLFNYFFGKEAGNSTMTGANNTATGFQAFMYNTTGYNNVTNGYQALYSNTTGSNNTAIGATSLYDLNISANDGSGNNTAIGYNTGRGIVTGINNTIIGANVGGLPADLSNNIIIADGSGNRRINVDSNGRVGIGTTASTALLQLAAGNTIAGSAPLKLTSGPLLAAPEAGAIEYDGTNLYYTDNFNVRHMLEIGGDSFFTNLTPTPVTVGGIAEGSTFNDQTVQEMFNQLLYPYIAPSISLSASPSTGTVREFGNLVISVTLNATTTKHTNDITSVQFFRNGSLTETQPSPIAGGGLETYTDTTPVTTNGITFTAKVGDGTQTVTSNGVSYTFVYPFYYGVGAPGLTGAQIRSTLTLLVKTPSNTTTTTSPNSQVFYLAYPNTSPALTSILDTNGFETIEDYTLRTVSISGLDGTAQTYKVYEYNNVTTQTNFTNTFKF